MARSGNHAVLALLTGPLLIGIYACGSVLGITEGTPLPDGGAVDAPGVDSPSVEDGGADADANIQADAADACVPRRKEDVCLNRCGEVTECTTTKYDCGGCGAGKTCGPAGTCVCAPPPDATLCVSRCGPTPDGCGKNVTCPTCLTGGCDPNCGCVADSDPTTCSQQGRECGSAINNCNQTVTSCGDCAQGQTCTTPGGRCCDTQAKACQGKCGTVTSNCGTNFLCSTNCGANQECDNNTKQCCATAAALCGTAQCGQVYDSVCNRYVDCGPLPNGNCAPGFECDSAGTAGARCCADQASSCQGKCGTVTNACGQQKFCGDTCATNQVCNGNTCCTPSCATCGGSDGCGGTCAVGVSKPCNTHGQCCASESCHANGFGGLDAGASGTCLPGPCTPRFSSGCMGTGDCCVGSTFCMASIGPDGGGNGYCE